MNYAIEREKVKGREREREKDREQERVSFWLKNIEEGKRQGDTQREADRELQPRLRTRTYIKIRGGLERQIKKIENRNEFCSVKKLKK